MTINFVNRNNCMNFCKYNHLIRTYLSKTPNYYNKSVSRCQCTISTIGSLTSKTLLSIESHKFNLTDDKKMRWYCTESNPSSNKLPPLMSFPRLVWPSFLKSIKNFVLATFIIKPYLDREFNLPDFVTGSKKAVEVVSSKLSDGDLKSLEGLVTNDIIPKLQKNVSSMSLSQREQLAIAAQDIYFSFPYQVQVGIIFDDGDKDQKRFVEITMVYHSLRGLTEMLDRGEEPPLNMGMLPEYQSRISICNYRFIREFTKGVESDWTVNLLNHFRPIDKEEE